MNIIPKPNGLHELHEGGFPAEGLSSVYVEEFDRSCLLAFEDRIGFSLQDAEPEQAALLLRRNTDLAPEGYILTVEQASITVSAASEIGVIWALTTLFKLKETNIYPAWHIEDSPKYAHRGFLLDCSRHFFSVEIVKEMIEINSLSKLNIFLWQLTNDQGWRIESKVFPKLHETNGQDYFTQDEIRDVIAFAKARGVDVIPNIDMPGHAVAAIAAYPELSCKGEPVSIRDKAGISTVILCAGKDSTYEFIKTLLDEIIPLFDSPYFHIGGDEAPKTAWESCPHCKAKLAEIGSESFEDLLGYFIQTVSEYVAGKGKIPICWNDVLFAQNLTQPMIIQQWLELGRPPLTKSFIENGGSVIFSDMFYLYLDYPEAMSSLSRVYAYSPSLNGVDFSSHKLCCGIQACLWTEMVSTKEVLFQRAYPRLFAVAEAAWTIERDYVDFERRLIPLLAEMKSKGLPFLPLRACNPKGWVRKMKIIKTLKAFSKVMKEDSEKTLPVTEEKLAYFLGGFDISLPKK